MYQPCEKHTASSQVRMDGHAECALGIVQRVDTVEREVAVLSGGRAVVFDVPSDCPVLLHGDRIKLRMVQPRDEVRVAFIRHEDRLVAALVEVQPGCDFSRFPI